MTLFVEFAFFGCSLCKSETNEQEWIKKISGFSSILIKIQSCGETVLLEPSFIKDRIFQKRILSKQWESFRSIVIFNRLKIIRNKVGKILLSADQTIIQIEKTTNNCFITKSRKGVFDGFLEFEKTNRKWLWCLLILCRDTKCYFLL